MNIQPFTIRVSDETLEELRNRLNKTRWPHEIEDSDWDYGSNLAYIWELCLYWARDFDWRAQEEQINRLPHFRADVDGLGIHFIHVRGAGPDPIPTGNHPRLAEHLRRDAENHPPALRPGEPRRRCRRFVRRDRSIHARLRVLRQAFPAWNESSANLGNLAQAHDRRPRLR